MMTLETIAVDVEGAELEIRWELSHLTYTNNKSRAQCPSPNQLSFADPNSSPSQANSWESNGTQCHSEK